MIASLQICYRLFALMGLLLIGGPMVEARPVPAEHREAEARFVLDCEASAHQGMPAQHGRSLVPLAPVRDARAGDDAPVECHAGGKVLLLQYGGALPEPSKPEVPVGAGAPLYELLCVHRL